MPLVFHPCYTQVSGELLLLNGIITKLFCTMSQKVRCYKAPKLGYMAYFRFKPEVIVLKRLFAILIGNLLVKSKSLLIEESREMLNADLFS